VYPRHKEIVMHKDLMSLPPRQQSLAFAEDDVWQKMPREVREQCHERIAQLLESVIEVERQERSNGNERQDPS